MNKFLGLQVRSPLAFGNPKLLAFVLWSGFFYPSFAQENSAHGTGLSQETPFFTSTQVAPSDSLQKLYRDNLTYTIEFTSPQVFYTYSNLFLTITITNEGNTALDIPISNNKLLSVQITVQDFKLKELKYSDMYLQNLVKLQQIPYRTVSLHPQESFSFELDLRNFFKIEDPDFYIIESQFKVFDKNLTLESNNLALRIQPPLSLPDTREQGQAVPSQQEDIYNTIVENGLYGVLQDQNFHPDQIVKMAIEARQRGNEQEYFLYFDLEELLLRDPSLSIIYKNSSNNERLAFLRKFRSEFWHSNSSVIPSSLTFFDILHTQYDQENAQVTVDIYFDEGTFVAQRHFTFYLNNLEGYWRIYDYQSSNVAILSK